MFEITFEEMDKLAEKYPLFTEEQIKKGTQHIVDAMLNEINEEVLNYLKNSGQLKLDKLKKKKFLMEHEASGEAGALSMR